MSAGQGFDLDHPVKDSEDFIKVSEKIDDSNVNGLHYQLMDIMLNGNDRGRQHRQAFAERH